MLEPKARIVTCAELLETNAPQFKFPGLFPERYVVCAAVKTTDGTVHLGKRHSDCFALIGTIGGIRYHLGSVQGFVDNRWEFLTRSEAFKVAHRAKQIAGNLKGRGILYSEDLY